MGPTQGRGERAGAVPADPRTKHAASRHRRPSPAPAPRSSRCGAACQNPRMLRLAPALTLLLLVGPIAVGVLWTLLPAFGYLPAIGAHELSLEGWRALLAYPGFATSLRLTLAAGVGATLLS